MKLLVSVSIADTPQVFKCIWTGFEKDFGALELWGPRKAIEIVIEDAISTAIASLAKTRKYDIRTEVTFEETDDFKVDMLLSTMLETLKREKDNL